MLHKRICFAMDYRGMSAKKLSEYTGINIKDIFAYKTGSKWPCSKNLILIMNALNTELDFLLRPGELPDVRFPFKIHTN